MGIFRQFPYSNFHDMNMDAIIMIMREMQDEWTATKAEWASYKDFIDNYFANLDVSEEVLDAMRVLASDGTLAAITNPQIASSVTEWLNQHITPTTPAIDTSLTVSGAAADAKVTGDAINDLKSDVEALSLEKLHFESGFYNDNGVKQAYSSRLRTTSKVSLDYFTRIDFPDGYKGYAIIYDEQDVKIGFYGYNSGNFSSSIYSSYVKASNSNAHSIGINVAKNDTLTGDISSFADYVSTNTKIIPKDAICGINYSVTDQASADIVMNNDVDNLPSQSIAYIASSLSIEHLPSPTFNGSIMTYVPAIFNETSKVQIAVETNNDAITYKRIMTNNGWSDWSVLVNNNNVHLLKYGTPITNGTDLLSITDIGTYYCPTANIAKSLNNCPTKRAFKMTIEYSTGDDSEWLLYKITDSEGSEFVNAKKNTVYIGWRKASRAPSLSYNQQIMLRDLFLEYVDNREIFYYDYNIMRDGYADGSEIYADKATVEELFPEASSASIDGFFKMNCSSFLEMVWMGRDVSDFIGKNAETYSNEITLYEHPTYGEFDFGYYFDFIDRKKCYKVGKRNEQNELVGLYSYQEDAPEPYSPNTRYSLNNTTGLIIDGKPLNQSWLLYETASDMALELYRKGCEIEFEDLQIGDLVFTKHPYNFDSFDYTSYRGIEHVAMVIGFNADGLPNFGEANWSYPTLVRSGYNYEYDGDVLHAQSLIRNAVMYARHPAAFGLGGNVPNKIEAIAE